VSSLSVSASSISKTENSSIPSSKSVSTAPCWKCSACGKEFNDVKHLVNHITFFVRQKDKNHLELYRKIKESSDKSSKSFTQVVEEMLKC